jgi:hypothetical protein
MEQVNIERRQSLNLTKFNSVKIVGDEITSAAFSYEVYSHQMEFRFNSASICTVTTMSEGLFCTA